MTIDETKPRLKQFTMMELLAVMVITSILVAMTLNIFKTDSTTANAQHVSGAINYAKSYAIKSQLEVKIRFNPSQIILTKEDPNNLGSFIPLKSYKLVSGGSITAFPSPNPFTFSKTGEPVLFAQQTITITNKTGQSSLSLYIKPFTAKVSFNQ